MTTTEAKVYDLPHQPVLDQISTPEQAVRTYILDPNPDVPESAYALGYLDGFLTGLRWDLGVHTDRDVREHERFNGPDSWKVAPASLPDALHRTAPVHVPSERRALLEGAGWLQGFADATVATADAVSCGVCQRRLLCDVEWPRRCERSGEYYCRWHAEECDSHRECHDDGGV